MVLILFETSLQSEKLEGLIVLVGVSSFGTDSATRLLNLVEILNYLKSHNLINED